MRIMFDSLPLATFLKNYSMILLGFGASKKYNNYTFKQILISRVMCSIPILNTKRKTL